MSDITKEPNTKKKIKKPGKRKKIIIVLLILFILLLFFLAAGFGFLKYLIRTTPEIDPGNIYSQLARTSVIYDNQGQIIQSIDSNENRTNVPIEEIPKNMVNAVISIEDKTFYEHHGFNYVRLMGAVVDSITGKNRISGTSTITQQLARNLYLTNERTIIRKFREAYYTVQLEKALNKDQIMEAYLNTIYLGFNSYGVQTAAQSYFSKNVEDLTLEECATLAAIPKNPSGYAPLKRFNSSNIASDNPNIISRSSTYTIIYNDRFVDRQHQVLDFMLEQKMISQVEYDQAHAVDMKTAMKPKETVDVDILSYFSDYLIKQVRKDLIETLDIDELTAAEMLRSGGLKIYSTIDVNMQKITAVELEKNKNFPGVTGLDKDRRGNILDSKGNIILYNFFNYFDPDGNFLLTPSEYGVDSDGNLIIFGGKRLNFYKTGTASGTDYTIEFKKLYLVESGVFYVINGGYIIIEPKYKVRTDTGDLVISKSFFQDNPDFFKFSKNGTYLEASQYTLKQKAV
ncbi:MAG: penicillin-binding protein, partial [Peptostreptococcaceae bacterium]|nr:penicillin-binding protein [Peptostreptococcaceae bacterium]